MNKFSSHLVNRLSKNDLKIVSQWITETGELEMISGEKGTFLSERKLKEWFKTSEKAIIIKSNKKIIGIATVSIKEVELNPREIEICHCIIHPKFRKLYNGSSLVIRIISYLKEIRKYNKIVARVNRINTGALCFFDSLHWERFTTTPPNDDKNVIWFFKELE